MTDLRPPSGDLTGPAAIVTALGAMFAAVFRRGMSPHKVRNEIAQVVLPILPRLAVLEARYTEIDRRLKELVAGQIRLEAQLVRLLER